LSVKTIVYLKRPQVTAGFFVAIVVFDERSGQIEGDDLPRVAKFLRVSDGTPQFDLEYAGRAFHRCRLGVGATSKAIPFWFDSTSVLEDHESDPNASYP